eukprot:4064989-Amphidinium_carterae.1
MWQQSPKRIYKWICGTAVAWDLAICAWLVPAQRVVIDHPSGWSASTIASSIKHCLACKAPQDC